MHDSGKPNTICAHTPPRTRAHDACLTAPFSARACDVRQLNSAIANGVVFFEKQTKFMNTCMLHMINNFMGVQFITYALAAATADHITDVTMRFGCDDAKLTLQCELPLYDETGNFRENVMHNYFSIVFGRDERPRDSNAPAHCSRHTAIQPTHCSRHTAVGPLPLAPAPPFHH